MRKTIYISKFIKINILILSAIAILICWPLGLIKERSIQKNPVVFGGSSEVINYKNTATQTFVANKNHMASVDVLVMDGTKAESFTVTFSSATGSVLATQKVEVPDTLPGYASVLLDVDTLAGEVYTMKFTSIKSLYLAQEPWNNIETVAVSSYNDEALNGMNIVMDYSYEVPFSSWKLFLYIGIVVLIAALLLSFTELVFANTEWGKRADRLISIEQGIKYEMNPLLVLFCVFCLVMIALGYVNEYLPDKLFAALSVIVFGLICYYAINHDRSGLADFDYKAYALNHIPDLIQTIAIAGALQGCCAYVSGLYDIHHRVAERKEMLWFCLIIIAMFRLDEIIRLYNLLYFIAAAVVAVIYCRKNILPEMDSDSRFVIKATALITVLLGFILIRSILLIVKKRHFDRPNLLYVIFTGLYFAMIIIFRNGRWWTVALSVAFTLLFFNYAFWERKKNFFMNVIRGAVLQFLCITVWCWLYRPYATFGCARYTHFFHTETVTATYMTVISGITAVLLLRKVRKTTVVTDEQGKDLVCGKLLLKNVWKELLLFAMAIVYMSFTMARTAYFATLIMVIAAFLLFLFPRSRELLLIMLKTVLYAFVAVILMIPVIFEIQRSLPAIVSEPYTYDIDNYQDEVLRGSQLNRPEYMMVGALADIFCEKILGIDDAGFDDYYNVDSGFNAYHATMLEIAEYDGYTWSEYNISDEEWDQLPSKEHWEEYVGRYDEYFDSEQYIKDIVGDDYDENKVYDIQTDSGKVNEDKSVEELLGVTVSIFGEDTADELDGADTYIFAFEDDYGTTVNTYLYLTDEEHDEYEQEFAVRYTIVLNEMVREKYGNKTADELAQSANEIVTSEGENGLPTGSDTESDAAVNTDENWEEKLKEDTMSQLDMVSVDLTTKEKADDYTNGRLSIYKSYIAQLNLTGHEGMGATLENGEIATHAHDVYLQVAYDHGIPVAVVFVLFGIMIFIASIRMYIKNKKDIPEAGLTMVLFIGFAVAGLVEWTYHLGHPMTLTVWLSITPLIFDRKEKRYE